MDQMAGDDRRDPRPGAASRAPRRLLRSFPPVVLAITLLGAALRLYGIGSESLWTDEVITATFVANHAPHELLVVIPLSQPHLPLYYVLLDLWTGAFGATETTMRLLSAAFAIASIPLIYAVGRRLFDHRTGVVAAALFSVSQLQIYYAQEVRMYSLVVLLTLLSLYWFVRMVRGTDGGTRAGAWYLLASLALIYTHPFGMLVIGAQNAYVVTGWLLNARDGSRLPVGSRRWLRLQAVVGLAVLPLFVGLLVKATAGDGTSFAWIEPPTLRSVINTLLRYFGRFDARVLALAYFALTAALAALSPFRYWVGSTRSDGGSAAYTRRFELFGRRVGVSLANVHGVYLLVLLVAVPLVTLFVASYLLFPIFWTRYTIPASVGVYLLVARGVGRVRSRHLRLLVVVVLIVSVLPSVATYHTTTDREEWDAATAAIERRAEPGDLVVVSDAIGRWGVNYYLDEELPVETVAATGSGTGRDRATDRELERTFAGHDRVWLVLNHLDERDREWILDAADDGRSVAFHEEFVGVELFLFERPTDGTDATERTTRSAAPPAPTPADVGGATGATRGV